MISEKSKFDASSKETVFMAESLCRRYPDVYWNALVNLQANGVKVRTLYNSNNIWIRDYMPVQVGKALVKFKYRTNPVFPQLEVSEDVWREAINGFDVINSDLEVDGGNVVILNDALGYPSKVVMTDIVFKRNQQLTEDKIRFRLESLFGVTPIFIPTEPGDELGHADGIVKFINYNTVFTNDYSVIYKMDKRFIDYAHHLRVVLEGAGLNVLKFPYAYSDWNWKMKEAEFRVAFPEADDFNPGFGYYINYFQADHTILLPAMRLERDKNAKEILRNMFPHHEVIMIDCCRLSMEGGLMNCVTWSLKE